MYQHPSGEKEGEEGHHHLFQHSNQQYNYDYNYGSTSAPANDNFNFYSQPQSHGQVQSQIPFQSSSLNSGVAPSAAGSQFGGAFDNVDISRAGKRLSGGTPFETVHEFVSVSNKVWFIMTLHFILF